MRNSYYMIDSYNKLAAYTERLKMLRQSMAEAGVDILLVPRTDAQQNEYLQERDERLAWLTGFTGSAGFAVIAHDKAALFIDGRYTLQAARQVDAQAYNLLQVPQNKPSDWIKALHKDSAGELTIGFDPSLHTIKALEKLKEETQSKPFIFKALQDNMIDRLWHDQPPALVTPLQLQPDHLTGRSAEEKINALRQWLDDHQGDALLVTQTDQVAWLFNIRAQDIACNPVSLSYALVMRHGPALLFTPKGSVTPEIEAVLKDNVVFHNKEELLKVLKHWDSSQRLLLDPSSCNVALADLLRSGGADYKACDHPVTMMKALKTKAELSGFRTAHERDGAAFVRFLTWFGDGMSGHDTPLDELKVIARLEAFRKETNALKDKAFDTIAGSGPNGAIVHYRADAASNRTFQEGDVLLLDSGAQYQDGTTDITRTLPIGNVQNSALKRAYTLVLKGHIAVASARFPDQTPACQTDALARVALWQDGKNFSHGTGHGVGSYLNVHEGPVSLSPRCAKPLQAGLVLSNEPGFYAEGEYGIRIENLVSVQPITITPHDTEKMLCFETLTLAPIDTSLIDKALMTKEELEWLNSYHAMVLDRLAPLLDDRTHHFLETACRPF
jgi:Xaa-Pro aminopeptidase